MGKNHTTKARNLKAETMIVAVDIGKRTHYGYFRSSIGNDVEPFAFDNKRGGFDKFWKQIRAFFVANGLKHIVVGFESSGPYAEPLFHFLRSKPVDLVQINPMHTKRIKELTGNSPNKTDKKDPRVIADVIALGHALTLVVPEGSAADLRRLTNARERCLKKITAAKNQLQDLVFTIFPEFLSVMRGVSSKTAIFLITHYPTPEKLAKLPLASLTAKMRKVSRGRIGQERARALWHAARTSVGIHQGKETIGLEIGHLADEIERQNQFIQDLEKKMAQHVKQIPYSRNILSIKGIGLVTTAGLIGEVGDFRKFKTIAEVTKLAGLDLYEISSGRHKGQRRISKRGRPLMRKLLFFAAINTVRANGIMNDRYHRMLDRGMVKMKALIAICRSLLAIIFALVRDGTMYMNDYPGKPDYRLAA